MEINLINYIEKDKSRYIKRKLKNHLFLNRNELFGVSLSNPIFKIGKIGIHNLRLRADINYKDAAKADVTFAAKIDVKFNNYRGAKTYSYSKKIRLETIIRIRSKISFRIKNIFVDHDVDFNPDYEFNELLMLYLKRNDYQIYADKMLMFYGVKRNKDGILNVNELIEKMNINVISEPFERDNKIRGASFLKPTEIDVYDYLNEQLERKIVNENTVVINSDITKNDFDFCYNHVICHECVHLHYHKLAFKLHEILNIDDNSVEYDHFNNKPSADVLTFMEVQANGISSHLLISDETLLKKANELIEEYKSMDLGDEINYMAFTIDALSSECGVTKLSLKRRLANLGFNDAKGALNYIDKHYIGNYLDKEGELNENEQYQFSEESILFFIKNNKKFGELFKNKKFIFVDNHVVINSDKYVVRGSDGFIQLTDYAKRNMNECCLVVNARSYANDSNRQIFLYKNLQKGMQYSISGDALFNDKNERVISFASNCEDVVEREHIFNDIKEYIKNKTFSEGIIYIKQKLNISNKALSINSGLSAATIHRYFKSNKTCEDKRTLVALCCGLGLDIAASLILFYKCNLSLDPYSLEDGMLYRILTVHQNKDPSFRNEIMIANGFDSITKVKKRKK